VNCDAIRNYVMNAKEVYEYLKEGTFYLKEKVLEIRFEKEYLE